MSIASCGALSFRTGARSRGAIETPAPRAGDAPASGAPVRLRRRSTTSAPGERLANLDVQFRGRYLRAAGAQSRPSFQDLASENDRIATRANSAVQKRTQLGKAADAFATLLSGRAKITTPVATEIMIETIGGSDAEGAWTPQDLYNAVESGSCARYAPKASPRTRRARLRFSRRSTRCSCHGAVGPKKACCCSNSRRPPAYAWVAARAAALVGADDLVLEPSAAPGFSPCSRTSPARA